MKKICAIALSFLFVSALIFAGGKQDTGKTMENESAADQVVYLFKYAHTQSDNHPRSLSMVYFKDQIEKASNGRIKVELYFNGVLGKEEENLDMVKLGSLQGCRGGLFERANKKFLIYTLPFMFENTDQVLEVMQSDIGKKINEGALANGIYVPVTGVAGGFRNITNNIRPITSVQDIKGLKMRTPPIDMTIKTFNAIGANPQQVAYTETYMALKSGVVDGQENPFSNTVDMKFYEAQKFLSIVNWQVHPDPLYVSPQWYNSLPDDLKKVFDKAAKDAMEYSNKIWLESENKYLDVLKENLKVNQLDTAARAGFIKACEPVYQGYVDSGYFTWDEINAIRNMIK